MTFINYRRLRCITFVVTNRTNKDPTVTVTEALVLRPLATRRPRAHHRIIPYLGARRQNETEICSDHDETSPSIASVSAPSVACSMLAVQQQKRLCRQFVDVSAARRGCHTMKRAV